MVDDLDLDACMNMSINPTGHPNPTPGILRA